jgi:hypothetical protein
MYKNGETDNASQHTTMPAKHSTTWESSPAIFNLLLTIAVYNTNLLHETCLFLKKQKQRDCHELSGIMMSFLLHKQRSSTMKTHPNSACRRASMLRNVPGRIAFVLVAMCCQACRHQGAAEIWGCHYSPHRRMLHKPCYINQWRVHSPVLGIPTILRFRGGRGPGPMARQSFDDSEALGTDFTSSTMLREKIYVSFER